MCCGVYLLCQSCLLCLVCCLGRYSTAFFLSFWVHLVREAWSHPSDVSCMTAALVSRWQLLSSLTPILVCGKLRQEIPVCELPVHASVLSRSLCPPSTPGRNDEHPKSTQSGENGYWASELSALDIYPAFSLVSVRFKSIRFNI
ncbi:hypothetical protein B0H34DRAFT_403373 [Crassisporium funariophilum]|nr:hypothetical protein B0H34DRAFT_403373 [Crassisporium funariophilum]